jgi:hypothetical protein
MLARRTLTTLTLAVTLALLSPTVPAIAHGPLQHAEAMPGCTEAPEPQRWIDAGTPDQGAAAPVLSAHRGASRLAPENTLFAYRHSFAYGADMVEVDIRETSDGRYVSLHDDNVDRTTEGTGPVSEMTFEEVRKLNAAAYAPWEGGEYDPAQIPSLEEILQLAAAAGGGIEFDIKDVSDASKLVDLAAEYGVLARSIFNTADPRVLANPDARVIYNRDTGEPTGSLYAIGQRASVFGSRLDEYSAESVAEIHDACGLVLPHSYDEGDQKEAEQLVAGRAIGIDGAQTNQPDVAADALDRPVATALVPGGGPGEVCLVNAANGLGLPALDLDVPGQAKARTDRIGCVRVPPQAADGVRFHGTGSAAASGEPVATPAGSPRGAHLSFVRNPRHQASVIWFTDTLIDPGSLLAYGPRKAGSCGVGDLATETAGAATPAPGVEVLTHEAEMVDLPAGAAICYRVGGASGWSPIRTFRTAEPGNAPFSFVAYGDHGRTPNSEATTAAVNAADPDFVMLAGDISYANGNQPVWDDYFNRIEPVASRMPYMVALGNHEVEDGYGTATFRNRFALPGQELYYSFDYANVHFVIVEGGAALEEGVLADELQWVDRDLADAAARRESGEIDFIVVVQHFPLWSNHDGRGPCDQAVMAVEEQILQRHQVDVLLVGHNHHFERSKPMAYGNPTTNELREYHDPAGYVEVIAGGGGQSLYNFVPQEEFQPWSAAAAKRFHYVRFDVSDDTLEMTAIATDEPKGEVLDTWKLHAADGAPQAPPPNNNTCA